MSLVSVVVSTYNGSRFIETQLQSIIDQTFSKIEIIVVDDASTDHTVKLVEAMSETHPTISVHAFKDNVGYIKNFERGIALAKGDYIALSDQDDWWDSTKIEKLQSNIGQHDMIYCDSLFTNETLEPNGISFSKAKHMLNSNNPLHFLIDNCVSGHAMLFKRSLFDASRPFPSHIPHDWWLTYCATLFHGICYYDEALVKYRFHDTNVIASNKTKKTANEKKTERQSRLQTFYDMARQNNHPLTGTIKKFNNSYRSLSLKNNINRVILFSNYKNDVLAILKKSSFKKFIFCLNMFFKLK